MAKDIHIPINITVEPKVRAIMRKSKNYPDEPLEVVDIQNVIKGLSRYITVLRRRISKLEDKTKKQKCRLALYEKGKE